MSAPQWYGSLGAIRLAMVSKWIERAEGHVSATPDGHVSSMLEAACKTGALKPVDDDTSDGYHRIGDLYRHRAMLTACLFNTWYWAATLGTGWGLDTYKTKNHHPDDDEPMFDGMFKVGAEIPTGEITYHYPLALWDLFQIPEREHSTLFDGHTSDHVADRLEAWLAAHPARPQEAAQ